MYYSMITLMKNCDNGELYVCITVRLLILAERLGLE